MWIAEHLFCPSLYFEILTTMLHVSMSSRDSFSIVWTYNCDCLVKKCVLSILPPTAKLLSKIALLICTTTSSA